jgi:hypothetical protein
VRRCRTDSDPFADVWQKELVPLLEKTPSPRASTLLDEPTANRRRRRLKWTPDLGPLVKV